MASNLITLEIELTDVADHKINTMINHGGEWFVIRSIVRIWYNPIKERYFMVCGARKFEGEFVDIPF